MEHIHSHGYSTQAREHAISLVAVIYALLLGGLCWAYHENPDTTVPYFQLETYTYSLTNYAYLPFNIHGICTPRVLQAGICHRCL